MGWVRMGTVLWTGSDSTHQRLNEGTTEISHAHSANLRSSARVVGIIFQTLAIATVALTLVGVNEVSHAGDQIGINGARDPFTWFVLIAGIFVALMFTGVGHILGMLCAVYDRQEPQSSEESGTRADASFEAEMRRQQKRYGSTVWEQIVEREEQQATSQSASALAPKQDSSLTSAMHPPRLDTRAAQSPNTGIWEWLTRERHFTKRSDQ